MNERTALYGYKQVIKSYLGDVALFDETPLSGKKAAFKTHEAKKSAFEKMTLPHIDALYGVALRLTREQAEAENLVQDTFLRAFRFFDRYTMGTNCRAWLFKILYNCFVNGYNKRAKEPVPIDSEILDSHCDEQIMKRGYVSETEERVFENLVDAEVVSALEKVPVDFKMPILLADVQQFPYDDISRMLEIPVGTVKSRIFRGRRILRSLLCDYGRQNGYLTA